MNDMHFDALRKAMVDSQIRPNKVIDDRVISAFMSVPRERFVTKNLQNIAYIDEDIHPEWRALYSGSNGHGQNFSDTGT